MTTSRIGAVPIALSIAFGFVGGAGSRQGSAKDQKLSGTIASSKRMADGKEWTTANLNVNRSSSYCYDALVGSRLVEAQLYGDAGRSRRVRAGGGVTGDRRAAGRPLACPSGDSHRAHRGPAT